MIERHEKPQQALDGKLPEITPQHLGYVGLFYAQEIGRFGLFEATVLHDRINFEDELGLDQMLLGIWNPEVLEYVPDRNSRYRKHRKQNARRIQNLQQPHSIGLYGKSLIPRLGTKFSWLERCPVTKCPAPVCFYSTASTFGAKPRPLSVALGARFFGGIRCAERRDILNSTIGAGPSRTEQIVSDPGRGVLAHDPGDKRLNPRFASVFAI